MGGANIGQVVVVVRLVVAYCCYCGYLCDSFMRDTQPAAAAAAAADADAERKQGIHGHRRCRAQQRKMNAQADRRTR